MGWQDTLKSVVNQPMIHARFLNTLSLLEYIGARKIIKSQDESMVNMVVLSHAAEEIRHAQILKKLALKVGGKSVESYSENSLIAGKLGRKYIQDIDQASATAVEGQDPWLCYLITTLIVEERAEVFYPVYEELIGKVNMSGPLKQIVRDEVNHLAQMREYIDKDKRIDSQKLQSIRALEEKNFNLFFKEVEREMNASLSLQSLSF